MPNEPKPKPRERSQAAPGRRYREQLDLLRLISDQGAIPLDQLARFVGIGVPVAETLVEGFLTAGWVESGQLLTDDYPWVWLRSKGARLIGRAASGQAPKPGGLSHRRGINEARLFVTARRPDGRWLSERRIRRRLSPGDHVPDAVFEVGGERHVIEVELTPKSKKRLREIVAEHCSHYDAVIYFCSEPVRLLLYRLAGDLPYANLMIRGMPSASGALGDGGWASFEKAAQMAPPTPVRLEAQEQVLLDLIAEQEAVSVDQALALLRVDCRVFEGLVERAIGRGLVEEDCLDGVRWLWLRRAGLNRSRVAGVARAPASKRLGELSAITEARLLLSERFFGSEWVSKFELRSRRTPGAKMPTAVLRTGGTEYAIEVEPRSVTELRLREIMASYCERYAGSYFVCSASRREQLERLAGEYRGVKVLALEPGRSTPINAVPKGAVSDSGRSRHQHQLMSLLAEQGPIAIDHVGRLMGLGSEVIDRLVSGAVDAGLVRRGDAVHGEVAWIWLSERGAREIGTDLTVRAPGLGGLSLARATNEARLYIQARAPRAVWVSRRRLLRINGRHAHVPRGVVEIAGERHAIDVEVRLRSERELAKRYDARSTEYDIVVVFCASGTKEPLDALCRERRWPNLRTVQLPRLGEMQYRRKRAKTTMRQTMDRVAAQGVARLTASSDDQGLVEVFGSVVGERLTAAKRGPAARLTLDELSDQTGMTGRLIREYQRLGLIPGPEVESKVAYYNAEHVALVELALELRGKGLDRGALRRLFDACRLQGVPDSAERLTMSELSRRTGVSRKLLLIHMTKGVLPPASSAGEEDYFGVEHVERVMATREMQASGYTLAVIREFFAGPEGSVDQGLMA